MESNILLLKFEGPSNLTALSQINQLKRHHAAVASLAHVLLGGLDHRLPPPPQTAIPDFPEPGAPENQKYCLTVFQRLQYIFGGLRDAASGLPYLPEGSRAGGPQQLAGAAAPMPSHTC